MGPLTLGRRRCRGETGETGWGRGAGRVCGAGPVWGWGLASHRGSGAPRVNPFGATSRAGEALRPRKDTTKRVLDRSESGRVGASCVGLRKSGSGRVIDDQGRR